MLKAIAISALLFVAQFASAQANVNESLETITYWVDATAGSDNNPGTQDAPFQTIGKATAQAETNNQGGVGTLINVNPGLYREAVTLKATGTDTPLPITIQAVTPGTAVMTGADPFTGWQPYSGNANIYQTVWPYQFGLCAADSGGGPFQQDIVLRREVAFVNGAPLTQVMSLNQMMQGTFFVDESNAAIYIYPAAGTNIGSADVEVGTRGALLTITAKSNVVVRGMTFEYSNSCRNGAALPVMSSDNVLLDNDSFYWNNAQGPAMTLDTNFTVQNNVANHNGIGGMAGDATKNSQWTNNVTNYNNWRGAQGAFYNWSSAGFHPYATHDDAISGLTSAYNQCFGIHWDTDNRDITADKMILSENLLSEALIEKSEGPITITNSTMCGGNPITNPANEIGFWLRNSEQVTISNSIIAGASQELFDVTGTPGGYPVTDWETGQVYNLIEQNIALNSSTIVGSALSQNVFYDPTLGGSDWASFLATWKSDYNTWWNPLDSTPFMLPVPVNNTQLDFPGWQAFTLQDQHSTFQAPTGNYPAACTVAPEGPDFWYVTDPIKGLLAIQAGGSASFTTTVVALGGFSGPVSLSVDGVQNIPGATYSWNTSTVNTSGSATLTVSTATTTPTGVYPITMVANNGAITRTLTGSVLVNTVLAVGPKIANMGSVAVGSTSANFPVTLADLGANGVPISSITTTGDFSQTNTCGTQVGGTNKFNYQCSITLTFTPTAVGTRTGTLTIVAADPGSPLTVSLTGVGVGVPVLGMSPTSMSFPDTDVKSQSAPSTVVLTNNGTATLNISNISFTGQNPSYFTQTNTCTAPLSPGSSCNVLVVFAPLYVGAVSANVSVTSDASVLPQTVPLTGNAVAPTVGVSTSSMSFGSQPIGLASAPMQSTITNTGNGPLLISSITITGSNAGDYSQTSTCPISPASLAVGASCTISAIFNPTALGVRFGNILITDNVVAGNTTITMSGTGTTPAAVSLSPSSLAFPSTNINTTSAPLPVTLTNTGNGALNITSIVVTGTNAGNFAQTNTCGSSVAAGATCIINVTFTPTATGARSGSVTITDNASPATQTISLSGTGTSATVSFNPASIVFGNQPQGLPSLPLPSVLTNTGTGPLIITGITITGNNPGDFTETSTCPISPASLAPGATCTILPIFSPTALGTRKASVTVADNVTGGSSTLTLTGTGVTAAGVTLSSSAVTFPSTDVNSVSAAIPVTLTNNGSGALTIVSILVNGTNASNFSQTNTCGTVVAAGASCVINATFAPTATGARSASITITDNASPATQTVTLAGTGVTPTISLTPTSLAFGNQAQGLTSAPLSSVLTNTGTGPLIITSITVGGTNSTDFTPSNTCPISPATLAVGGTCTITATFTPTALGARNASITIADNVTSGNPSLPLSGTGTTPAAVILSPSSLSFPATDVNSLSAPIPVTLTNTGNGTLTITSVTLTGLNATNYSQTNTCGTSVAAGASCVITVTFAPTATGTRTASLTVTDNASPSTQTVALTGSAVTPTITMSPTSLAFPNTTDGTTSAPLTTTLTNTGTGPLIITSIVLGGTNATDFAQTNTCPISPNTLAVNGTCSITATFSPTAMSSRSATITINSNALGAAKTVALSGTGIAFTVSYTPSSWAFPSTIVGVPSTSKTITLKNLGSINLNITSVQITGANPGDFSQTNTCGTTVLPNASCTFSVIFTPQGTGPRSAALSVSDNGDSSPQAVALTGTGTQPLVSLSPSSLVYTVQQYNTASKTQKVTVTNNGTAALTISAIGFTGANAADFSETTTCPISTGMLAIGSSCTVTVTFTPKGMGPRSANLTITDNAPASPQVAALTGTGTFVKLTPTTLAFTAITVGRSSGAKTVTFTNVGNASLTMNGISLTGANPGDFTQTNTCGTSVAPGGTCIVTVTFKPTALGARAANLYFDDSDGAGPQTVTLSGTGI